MTSAWKWDPAFLPASGGRMYGWFFWMWTGILLLLLAACLCLIRRKGPGVCDRLVFGFGLALAVAEVYKQVFFTKVTGTYQWDLFPWQLCSVPMYASMLFPLVRNKKLKEAGYRFLAFYGLTAGAISLALPDGLYWEYVTITCHSFFWHVSLTLIGILLIVSRGYARSLAAMKRELLPAFAVFGTVTGIALLLNTGAWSSYFRFHPEQTFNMFCVSPFYRSSLQVFMNIQPHVPYPVFLLLYLFAATLGACLVWLSAYGIRRLGRRAGVDRS